MKTEFREEPAEAAPIVALAAEAPSATVERARAFAEPLLAGQLLDTGEDALAHAEGVSNILAHIGAAPSLRIAAYLVYAGDFLAKPEEMVQKAFGESQASLVTHTRKLVAIQRATRAAHGGAPEHAEQTERVRKMLLAFSRDLRVVLLRLASRLQTLRYFAASRKPCPVELARESMQVFAPLANRLGIWQIKWELEDLAFRFLQPSDYHAVAELLHERRTEREEAVERFRCELADQLAAHGLQVEVHGRPKHLYSIWKKMHNKGLDFARVFDIRAVRVIARDVPACYAVLAWVHQQFKPIDGEMDDYIARPKPNGYRSLHTVVLDSSGRPVEVQIRTREMHEHAEHGVAAHWAYKEAGVRGYGGVNADSEFDAQVAEARKAVLRQLLEWERDFTRADRQEGDAAHAFDDRIYVFTPQLNVVELPARATAVDFAYALHTDIGHRCRGAKIDGAMVPLNTALANGQTVEITTVKEGGPSLDWINPELGYLHSSRAKAKVRAWFNALATADTVAKGRELVEKLLQREGKTAMRLEDIAGKLQFRSADALFEAVGKDEFSLKQVEALWKPAEPLPSPDEFIAQKHASRRSAQPPKGGVLVVGVDSLLTTLARCCRPAPPDTIAGYVTRGRGVAIHRADCKTFKKIAERSSERVIAVEWGVANASSAYPVDVMVEASDRQGLLRDISEVFAKEKMNVTGVNSQSVRGGTAWMTFTVEVNDTTRLETVLQTVARVAGVRAARRR